MPAVSADESAAAVLAAVFPLAAINSTRGISVLANAVLTALMPLAIVHAAIRIAQNTAALLQKQRNKKKTNNKQ